MRGSQVAQAFFRVMDSLLRPPFHSIGTSEERPPTSSIFCLSKQRRFPHVSRCLLVFVASDRCLQDIVKTLVFEELPRFHQDHELVVVSYGWYFCRVNQLQFGILYGQGFLYPAPIGPGVSGDSHVMVLYSNGFTSHGQGMQAMETLAFEPRSCKAIAKTAPIQPSVKCRGPHNSSCCRLKWCLDGLFTGAKSVQTDEL